MEEHENKISLALNLFSTVILASCVHLKDLGLPKEFVKMPCKELVEIIKYHILQINVQAEICLCFRNKEKEKCFCVFIKNSPAICHCAIKDEQNRHD